MIEYGTKSSKYRCPHCGRYLYEIFDAKKRFYCLECKLSYVNEKVKYATPQGTKSLSEWMRDLEAPKNDGS